MSELIAYHVETQPGAEIWFQRLQRQHPAVARIASWKVCCARQGGHRAIRTAIEQQMSFSVKVRGTLQYVDRIDARLILGSHPMWFALQGVVELPEGDTLDLTAGSYDAWASVPRLLAFNVEDIVPPV